MEDWLQILPLVSNPIMAACAVYIAKSIHDLNTRIAVIIERVDSHEKRLTRIEDHEYK